MPTRVILANGGDVVVKPDIEEVASAIWGDPNLKPFERAADGERVYVHPQHVVALEPEPGSVYDQRGIVSTGE